TVLSTVAHTPGFDMTLVTGRHAVRICWTETGPTARLTHAGQPHPGPPDAAPGDAAPLDHRAPAPRPGDPIGSPTIVAELAQQLIASATDPGIRDQLVAFQREHQALDAAYEAALAPFVADGARDPSVPDRAVRGQDRPPTDRVDRIVTLVETSITDSIAGQKA